MAVRQFHRGVQPLYEFAGSQLQGGSVQFAFQHEYFLSDVGCSNSRRGAGKD